VGSVVVKDEPVEFQPERVVPSRLNPLLVLEDTDDADDADDAAELRLAAAVVMAETGTVRRPAANPKIPTRMAAKPMTRTMSPVGFRGAGAAGLDHG
jgi:hypothetical protein